MGAMAGWAPPYRSPLAVAATRARVTRAFWLARSEQSSRAASQSSQVGWGRGVRSGVNWHAHTIWKMSEDPSPQYGHFPEHAGSKCFWTAGHSIVLVYRRRSNRSSSLVSPLQGL